jgi:hypothetical protein
MRVWILAAFAVVLVAGGAAVAALLAWPTAGIASSTTGLATVSLPGFSGDVQGVSVKGPEGRPLPIGLSHGIVWPHARLAAGTPVTVTVEVAARGGSAGSSGTTTSRR